MNLLDIFEGREPHQQAIDRLEHRRIEDLEARMDDCARRGDKEGFRRAKEERDSYHRVNTNEGSMKHWLEDQADLLSRDQFVANAAEYGMSDEEAAEFWDYWNGVEEAGIGHDIVNKTEKMARANPPTKAGAVASTVKNAAKWLAGKGGPGKEGPTYEGKDDAWSQEGEWKKIPKSKSGNPVDPRGEVTHLSDVARREAERKAAQKKNSEEIDEHGGGGGGPRQWHAYVRAHRADESTNPKLDALIKNIQARVSKDAVKRPEIMKRVAQMVQQADPEVQDALATAHQLVQQYGQGIEPKPTNVNDIKAQARSGNVMAKLPKTSAGTKTYAQQHATFEGWSDAIVAQRTGQPRTPYSVYIKGKKWKDFENDDHAEAVANKLRAKFEREGRDPSVITIAPTDYDKGIDESKEAVFRSHDIEVEYPEGKGHSHIYHRREPYRLSTIFSDANSVAARNRRAKISLFVDGEYIPNYEWQEGVDAPNGGIAEHGGGVNSMKQYIAWRQSANKERGITKKQPVGKMAPQGRAVPKGTVHGKLDQSRGVIPSSSFHEADDVNFGHTVTRGGWIAFDPETKQIKKRFKTHTAGKSYAQTHGLGFASSEHYFDRVKEPVEETVTDVRAGMAKIYNKLAPKIERYKDSFLANQLYDELEAYAELHGAEDEFKRMMNGARNRAHMEYDTNPGGFQNWFWFLPFGDEVSEEKTRLDPKCWKGKKIGNPKTKMKGGVRVNNCVPAESVEEEWSEKYKRSIDCSHPKGFSQKAHCAGRKKNEGMFSPLEENNEARDAVESAIIRRIMVARTDLLKKFGPQKVMDAAQAVADEHSDVEEIGTSDVSAFIQQVERYLAMNH